jgi:glycosyltransferase involved in cell wall biosynthesis
MNWRVISCLTSGRISGVDIFAFHLTEGLLRRGIDARILMTHPDKVEIDRLPLPQGVPIDTLPKEWRSKRRYRRRALREYLKSQAPCIYIPNYDYDHSPISASLPPDIYTIGIVHSDDPMHYDHVFQLGRFWDAVVAVSQKIADTTSALPRIEGRLHTIPYGIPCSHEVSPRDHGLDKPLQILYVGRLEQTQKRVLDMPRILDRLKEKGIPAVLTLVGDGPARTALEEAGRDHISAGNLRLLGTKPNDEMPALYQAADVFLLTSAFEGLPVSLLEAMSYGCVPVVTHVRSGVSEVVHDGKTGCLVNVGDIDGIADRLAELEKNPVLRQSMSKGAAEFIKQGEHSVDRMVDRYLDLFHHITRERAAGAFERPDPYFAELFVRNWQCRIRRNMRRLMTRAGYPTSP